jgi:putative thioredoxin
MQEKTTEREPVVLEVTDADFPELVLEESTRRPVVVDLWAEWCAPCRTLGPILEKVARERDGAFLLAKLDVDANPMTSSQFGVQSIPTVVAFRDGQPVNGFVGAYPEPQVNEFIDSLLPSAADRGAEEAREEALAGDLAGAEQRYRDALAGDPDNRAARIGLARMHVDREEYDEAIHLIEPVLPDPEAERIAAAVRIAGWNDPASDGPLGPAKALAARGEWRSALEEMLAALRTDPSAREPMLDIFAVLGEEDPLTQEFRRKLSSALF